MFKCKFRLIFVKRLASFGWKLCLKKINNSKVNFVFLRDGVTNVDQIMNIRMKNIFVLMKI